MKFRFIPIVAALAACSSLSFGATAQHQQANQTAKYPMAKLSGFTLNWGSTQGGILKDAPYSSITGPISIGFATNDSNGGLHWGGPTGPALTADAIKSYTDASGKPASQFMLSFGGATNNNGWNSICSMTDTQVNAVATNLAGIVKSSGIMGIDIDVDQLGDACKSNFSRIFPEFLSDLKKADSSLKTSLDLPNTGGCSSSLLNNEMCQTFASSPAYGMYPGIIKLIDPNIDWYNAMAYSWGTSDADTAVKYTTQSVQSYIDNGMPAGKINLGVDVAEPNDKAAINADFLKSVESYANTKKLKGIFIYSFNDDHTAFPKNSVIDQITGTTPPPPTPGKHFPNQLTINYVNSSGTGWGTVHCYTDSSRGTQLPTDITSGKSIAYPGTGIGSGATTSLYCQLNNTQGVSFTENTSSKVWSESGKPCNGTTCIIP